jgi:hypothetical protein
MEMEIDRKDSSAEDAANAVINSVTHCIDRGKDKGKCHVFLDHSNVCECGAVDLEKSRMK